MSAATVKAAFIGAADRLAKFQQNGLANATGGTAFRDRADAAADATYEDRMFSAFAAFTDLDTALAAGSPWSDATRKRWFTQHEAYFATDLGYGNSAPLASYLAAKKIRVPWEFAEAYTSATGKVVPAPYVFPKGTLVADEATAASSGMHLLGTLTSPTTWVAGSALPSTCGPVGVLVVGMGATQTAEAVFRCTNYVGAATKDITWSLSGAAQYKQTILGAQALGSGVSAGAVTLPVAATGQFTAGEWVLVYESDSLQEVALVSSLTTNTSLTVPAIQNAYTTDALVIPLFGAVTYQSGGTGTGNATVYALPDRIIAL